MTKRQWKNLLNAIHHGNCILMLGPAVSSREQNHQFTLFSQLFAEELAEELEEEEVDYAKEHRQNLSYISQLYEKMARSKNPYGDGTAASQIVSILEDQLLERRRDYVSERVEKRPMPFVIPSRPFRETESLELEYYDFKD